MAFFGVFTLCPICSFIHSFQTPNLKPSKSERHYESNPLTVAKNMCDLLFNLFSIRDLFTTQVTQSICAELSEVETRYVEILTKP